MFANTQQPSADDTPNLLWFIDTGPGLVHKNLACATSTAANAGASDPLCRAVMAANPAGWRLCKCVYS